jgi:predicted enzyme related to lactoylglutathione lyase
VITGVRKIVVPVGDQQAAKDFWVDTIGFQLVRDDTYGDERWVEVKPEGQDLVLVLDPRLGEPRREPASAELPHSDVFFDCEDIHRTYQELTARGVVFASPPTEMHFGWWALFTDPDGTRYALGQWA